MTTDEIKALLKVLEKATTVEFSTIDTADTNVCTIVGINYNTQYDTNSVIAVQDDKKPQYITFTELCCAEIKNNQLLLSDGIIAQFSQRLQLQ